MAKGQRETESQGNGGSTQYQTETRESGQDSAPGRQLEHTGRRGGLQTTRGWPGLLGGGIPASPWDLVRRMTDEMNQLFQSLGGTGAGPAGILPDRRQTGGTAGMAPLIVPRTEVIRQPDALLVRVDLPGLTADEIDVTVEDGLLTIAGERRQEDVQEGEGFIRSELTYGTFLRTIPLPEGADEDKVEAVVRNGVLEIRVPIEKREQGRRVNVQGDQSERSEVRSDRSAGQSGNSEPQTSSSQAQSGGSEAQSVGSHESRT